ncbi:MAG: hypothetical protein R2809_07680 [Flavobacteriales bacterium]
MITKRFTIIYLSLAPALFALSWYISHRIQIRFMSLATGELQDQSNNKPFIYASIFTALYLGAYLVIRDLYKTSPNK